MNRRIAKVSPSGLRFYYHTDLVGTPLVITDQGGNLSWRGEYLPFGSESTSTDAGDHFKFTGKELEDHTGLYYFEARYYEPATGRFISIDPVGGNVGNSQSWNRYAYVLNIPAKYVDPDGETPGVAVRMYYFDSASVSDIKNGIKAVGTAAAVVAGAPSAIPAVIDAVDSVIPTSPKQTLASVQAFAAWGPALEAGAIAPGARLVAQGARLTWNQFQKLFARQGFRRPRKPPCIEFTRSLVLGH